MCKICEFTADSVTRSRRDSTPNFAPPENLVHVDRYDLWTDMTGQALILVLPTCQRKRTAEIIYMSLPSSLPLKVEDWCLYKY